MEISNMESRELINFEGGGRKELRRGKCRFRVYGQVNDMAGQSDMAQL
jgi:hypothetical protein